jgi:hypothetical protein
MINNNINCERTSSDYEKGCHRQAVNYNCSCGKGNCTVKTISRIAGLSTAVVDDAEQNVYIYGNIQYENHHNPVMECQPFLSIPLQPSSYKGLAFHEEVFDGEFDNNTITLAHTPDKDNPILVFKNGLKQIPGDERDYNITGDKLHFNFYTLQATDVVDVLYRYIRAGE